MPLTEFQKRVALSLAENRSEDSHLAGGAAIHLLPNSQRFSYDLDYFHDSAERVSSAFESDQKLLTEKNFEVSVVFSQVGFVQAVVSDAGLTTKVEWSHDSAWRFLPVVQSVEVGYQLHPIDLAVNKVLALIGRNEPRDLLDTLFLHKNTLSLGALCWAASGKDPGFTPKLILAQIRRRGVLRDEDVKKLNLVEQPNLQEIKNEWLQAIASAEEFINSRPADEIGCLYYLSEDQSFTGEKNILLEDNNIQIHHGALYGVQPKIV